MVAEEKGGIVNNYLILLVNFAMWPVMVKPSDGFSKKATLN